MMQILTTKEVLAKTTAFCKQRLLLFIGGALLFGVLSGVAALIVEAHFAPSIAQNMEQFKSGKLGSLLTQLESGDVGSIDQLMSQVQSGGAGLDALSMLSLLMPTVYVLIWSLFISMIISLISSAYFFYMCRSDARSIAKSFGMSIALAPAMLLLATWSSVRSFSWVPFIGPIIGLILLPRLLFAPVAYIVDDVSLSKAVSTSITGTKGSAWYVLSVFSYVTTIVAIATFIIVFIVALFTDALLGSYAVLVRSAIWQAALGFSIISLVIMWEEPEPKEVVAEDFM